MFSLSKAIETIERFTLTDDFDGQKVQLRDWQKEIIQKILTHDKTFVFLPRGNGKSQLVLYVALLFLLLGKRGQQIIVGASALKQTRKIYWPKLSAIIKADKHLSAMLTIREFDKEVIYEAKNSRIILVAADGDLEQGAIPSLIILDELEAHKSRKLYDALSSAAHKRIDGCKFLMISTAGELDKESLAHQLWSYAVQVRDNPTIDASWASVLYQYEEGDNWDDVEVWRRCNPAADDFFSLDSLAKQIPLCRIIPAERAKFETFNLNHWVDNVQAYIPMTEYRQCIQPIKPNGWVFCGLDVAASTDICSAVLTFDDYTCKSYHWTCEESVKQREIRNKVRFDNWIDGGYIKATKGKYVNQETVIADLLQINELYPIRAVVTDMWNSVGIGQRLQEEGIKVEYLNQSHATMNSPLKKLLELVLSHELKVEDNPVLTWMMGNLKVHMNFKGLLFPDKEHSTEKIDGVVALLNAICYRLAKPATSMYG